MQYLKKIAFVYLLTNTPPAEIKCSVKFIRFPQQWVEGFPCSNAGCGIGRHCKSSYMAHLLTRRFTLGSSVENTRIFKLFCQPLKHGQWFIEIYLVIKIGISLNCLYQLWVFCMYKMPLSFQRGWQKKKPARLRFFSWCNLR